MFVNIFGNRILGKYNDYACESSAPAYSLIGAYLADGLDLVYWSILGCLVISIVILTTSDKNSAEFVFTDFANETGYTDGVAWILGLLQSALSLIGYDVIMHMTEEMPRPRKDAPIAILLSIIVGGVTYVLPVSYA